MNPAESETAREKEGFPTGPGERGGLPPERPDEREGRRLAERPGRVAFRWGVVALRSWDRGRAPFVPGPSIS